MRKKERERGGENGEEREREISERVWGGVGRWGEKEKKK